MTFTALDAVIIVGYLVGIAVFGIVTGGRQQSARDYFVSERSVPWWAACFAIVATETSALTFLSIPGIAYTTNLNFLQLSFGYLLGRIIIARWFLPSYFDGELSTAYAFLERRFGVPLRRTASVVFMGTRTFADGVRLYTTAIPLTILLQGTPMLAGFDAQTFSIIAIVLLSILTLVYVLIGGVRAVIWTDVIQLFIYVAGAVIAIVILLGLIPLNLGDILAQAGGAGKLSVFATGFEDGWWGVVTRPYTLIGSVVGGMFLSMASHGTDHLIVQRLMATNHLARARKALVWSGVIVIVQFLLFLFVGTLLWEYHQGAAISSNEVFSRFIIEHIPTGLCGFIIAGIMAAAMSTLSGSISSLSASTLMDIVVPMSRRTWDEATQLRWSRLIALGWTLVLMLVATLFINTPKTVVELALSIASYTYGGLLGVFLLGFFTQRVSMAAAITGFAAGIAAMSLIIAFTPLSWTWYTMAGSLICIVVAGVVHVISSHRGGVHAVH